jgi:ATP-dependent protease ClpP protease subunit
MKRSLRRQVTGLKVLNQADGLTLEIYDVIGADWFGEGITGQLISDELKNSSGPVHVRINSPGGDAFEAVAIYNILRNSGRPVDVRVDGLCASAASVIAMAADSRLMGRGTMMMIHPAMMMAAGDATEMRRVADVLDSVTVTIADIYSQHTKNKQQQVVDWMNAETWMNPQDAMDKGFATGMSDANTDVKALASHFDLSLFKHAPEQFITNRMGHTKKVDGENLTAEDFIYVGDPEDINTWHLPWRFSTEEKTVSHLRDALARFNQTGIPPTKKAAAYEKLVGLCKEHGIDVGDDQNPSNLAGDGLYMIDLMRKRVAILRNR